MWLDQPSSKNICKFMKGLSIIIGSPMNSHGFWSSWNALPVGTKLRIDRSVSLPIVKRRLPNVSHNPLAPALPRTQKIFQFTLTWLKRSAPRETRSSKLLRSLVDKNCNYLGPFRIVTGDCLTNYRSNINHDRIVFAMTSQKQCKNIMCSIRMHQKHKFS